MPAFFIQSQDVVDGVVTITDPLLGHIAKSLRAKAGDSLLFNDDQGHRYHTTVVQITKQTLQAKIQHAEDQAASVSTLQVQQPTVTVDQHSGSRLSVGRCCRLPRCFDLVARWSQSGQRCY